MWNKLFKNKSKTNQNKSKLSIVVKSFSLRKNSKDNDCNGNSANDLVEKVATLAAAGIYTQICTLCRYRFSYTYVVKIYIQKNFPRFPQCLKLITYYSNSKIANELKPKHWHWHN